MRVRPREGASSGLRYEVFSQAPCGGPSLQNTRSEIKPGPWAAPCCSSPAWPCLARPSLLWELPSLRWGHRTPPGSCEELKWQVRGLHSARIRGSCSEQKRLFSAWWPSTQGQRLSSQPRSLPSWTPAPPLPTWNSTARTRGRLRGGTSRSRLPPLRFSSRGWTVFPTPWILPQRSGQRLLPLLSQGCPGHLIVWGRECLCGGRERQAPGHKVPSPTLAKLTVV